MLKGIDLNLMVSLDALLRERHVTRAAKRVGVSQPAMSNALGRLRRLLGDPLLVRTGSGMAPTARALALETPVREALEQIHRALQPQGEFDPGQTCRTFTIATGSYVEHIVLPRVIARLASLAPEIALHVEDHPPAAPKDALASGRIGLVIGRYRTVPPTLRSEPLFEERPVCVVRRDHPLVGKRLTLKRFVKLQHVLVRPKNKAGLIDRLLAEKGLRRQIALMTQDHVVALRLVAQSDLVVTVPSRLARLFQSTLPIRILRPPLEIPGAVVQQLWHPRADTDKAHAWLRNLVREVCATLASAEPSETGGEQG